MSKVKKPENIAEAGFTHRTAMEEAARCLLCYDPPCNKGCPAGTEPAKFIRSIRFRNPKGAAETIRENNVLGGVCARICPFDRFCEEACSRCGIDRPIEIGKLQRYAIEQEQIFDLKTLKAPKEKKAARVACVGAGPASLAAAAKLATEGYRVTVFEKEAHPGGILAYGIAFSRLPQEVVDYDIEHIRSLGVSFEFGKTVGQDADLTKMNFDAVFIGTGLGGAKLPEIPGKSLEGVYKAVDFLRKARTQRGNFTFGDKAVIIGGGNVAVDCAVSAKLLGASHVSIVCREVIEQAPADMKELHYALSLGVGITTYMTPVALEGDATALRFVVFKGMDNESELKLAADAVIFATGQQAEDMSKIAAVELTAEGYIKVSDGGRTSAANVFAGGDITGGGRTVVEAVRAGKEAAASIIRYLEGKGADQNGG